MTNSEPVLQQRFLQSAWNLLPYLLHSRPVTAEHTWPVTMITAVRKILCFSVEPEGRKKLTRHGSTVEIYDGQL